MLNDVSIVLSMASYPLRSAISLIYASIGRRSRQAAAEPSAQYDNLSIFSRSVQTPYRTLIIVSIRRVVTAVDLDLRAACSSHVKSWVAHAINKWVSSGNTTLLMIRESSSHI